MYYINGVRLECREILEFNQQRYASQTERFRSDVWSTVSAMKQVISKNRNRIARQTLNNSLRLIAITNILSLT